MRAGHSLNDVFSSHCVFVGVMCMCIVMAVGFYCRVYKNNTSVIF